MGCSPWATERLARSHDYWLATVSADGRPHAMPVWGVWQDGALWFSSSRGSRKARNLAANPWCVLTTDAPDQPVVIEGRAELLTDLADIGRLMDGENTKYDTSYGMEMFDPALNATFRVRPQWAFGLAAGDFTGSPTRWTFPAAGAQEA